MSMNDIMNSYDVVEETHTVCNKYWYFKNDTKKVRRLMTDLNLMRKLVDAAVDDEDHTWCMVPNYMNITVMPFMSYDEYNNLTKNDEFEFVNTLGERMSRSQIYGDYIVWPDMSTTFIGWMLYLRLNFGLEIKPEIPLKGHKELGPINLLTCTRFNMDVSCKIYRNDTLVFTNTDSAPNTSVFRINENVVAKFGKKYVNSSNKVWFNFLLNTDYIKKCHFLEGYTFIDKVWDISNLRGDSEHEENYDIVMRPVTDYSARVTPCSEHEFQIDALIDDCLKAISDGMEAHQNADETMPNLFEAYMKLSEYANFYIVLNSVWVYCYTALNMKSIQYEDVLYFLKSLCRKMVKDEDKSQELFDEHFVYVSRQTTVLDFFNSLTFFVNPEMGMTRFFEGISAYFLVHFRVYKRTESWVLDAFTVEIMPDDVLPKKLKSMGFFRKIKSGRFDYIFNGSIYEHYKNRKEHPLASVYSDAPETTVNEMVFNRSRLFYITQDGVFDVCKKVYKERCPFLVQSTINSSYIARNQTYLNEDVFRKLFSAIDCDLDLFKMYHARKIVHDFEVLRADLRDYGVVNNVPIALKQRFESTIRWLLNYKMSDLLLIVLRKEQTCLQLIQNVLKIQTDDVDNGVDLNCLRVGIVCLLMWPESKLSKLFFSLLCTTIEDCKDFFLDEYGCDVIEDENALEDMYIKKMRIVDDVRRIMTRMDWNTTQETVVEWIKKSRDAGPCPIEYEHNRAVKGVGQEYDRLNKLVQNNPSVWQDLLLVCTDRDNMYTWMVRFYLRVFLRDCNDDDEPYLRSVIQGLAYFRVFTNFHSTNSKVIINFCASLAIPVDHEKMCLVLTSKPNCGKSSLWELLGKMIVLYKQDKEKYKNNKNERDEKVKQYECQLYVMNEAHTLTKLFLKTNVDSTRIDSARRNYGIMEKFYSNYKVLVCNNDKDKLFVCDGYDEACDNRLGQLYFDHHFVASVKFSGSVYEHHVKKSYCEVRDINTQMIGSVREFLANVLRYNCDDEGQLRYKRLLIDDPTYKYNKQCLSIYNTRIEALMYVLNVHEKMGESINEEKLTSIMETASQNVSQMVHIDLKNRVDPHSCLADFRSKFNSDPKYYNPETKKYTNLNIALDVRHMKCYPPKFSSNYVKQI
uniref:Helicase 1 n=1 Tax=Phthorimaea operculella granulovirus TaxID=192584 RepID=A0A1B2CS47_9BBAC|nr:helicase 1 [Phthorimaea operculella granulovirus]QBH65917.1 helicase 1 [Phthorimaea operculella granulovirus]QBH66697.1 helicase 1 [Phthorimaea operculella granulovirus]QBH66827.1 helicase 1 [Phthorimaea operculella granulovirus]QBH66957.1 helicase 1 [Phthorimaea operculella granulovirus]